MVSEASSGPIHAFDRNSKSTEKVVDRLRLIWRKLRSAFWLIWSEAATAPFKPSQQNRFVVDAMELMEARLAEQLKTRRRHHWDLERGMALASISIIKYKEM
jgi:hypothetical protein